MFERYTEKARRAIFFARYEAGQHGAAAIESEHILLGILRTEEHLASAFIESVSEQATMRSEIESQIPSGERIPTNVEMRLSAESKVILKHAEREADKMNHGHIGTGHLFLGILDEPTSLGARILSRHSADIAKIRQAVASSRPS
jgi:ATP-dependent Clp protease ATP-binding subunit ClpC